MKRARIRRVSGRCRTRGYQFYSRPPRKPLPRRRFRRGPVRSARHCSFFRTYARTTRYNARTRPAVKGTDRLRTWRAIRGGASHRRDRQAASGSREGLQDHLRRRREGLRRPRHRRAARGPTCSTTARRRGGSAASPSAPGRTGRRRWRGRRPSGSSRRSTAAAIRLADIEAERAAPTMWELADRFEAEHLPRKAASTADSYRSMLRLHVRPHFGSHMKVADVSFSDIDRLHRKITATGHLRRANAVVATVAKMFSLAVRWDMRADNPAQGRREKLRGQAQALHGRATRWRGSPRRWRSTKTSRRPT